MVCQDFEVQRSIPIQCPRCGQSESARLPAGTMEEIECGGKTQLYCSTCKSLVDFRRVPAVDPQSGAEPDLLVTAQEIFPVCPESRAEARRRRFRICPKNMKACIRLKGASNIADVMDYSRTGVRVMTTVLYQLGAIVEVAVDYTVGGTNIFQPARIATLYSQPLADIPGEYELAFQGRK